jgi:uncharacterized protein YqeY
VTIQADLQDGVRSRLRTGLTTAMKARDMAAVKAIRSALGAIDNAESVDTTVDADQIDATSRIAGAVAGGGAAEARRRELTEADIITVVRSEIDDRLDAAAEYDATGEAGADRAALLRAEASTLAGFIAPSVDARP